MVFEHYKLRLKKKELLKEAADVFFESKDNLAGLAALEILKQDDYLKFMKTIDFKS